MISVFCGSFSCAAAVPILYLLHSVRIMCVLYDSFDIRYITWRVYCAYTVYIIVYLQASVVSSLRKTLC
jgi:hypothetical protein